MFKSAGQAAGQAATQAVMQKMSPQAQTAVAEANKLPAGAQQENYIVAKAKEYLAARNYQPALDLSNYVLTNINAKSLSAQKIMTDAKAALTKMAQDKMAAMQQTTTSSSQAAQAQAQVNAAQQVKNDATQTATSLKSLFGK